jgi:shikimate kinase
VQLVEDLQGLNIYLVGMMGSGKSTIGRSLAHRLDYRYFDTDVLIERTTQKTITNIFAEEGETYFRNLETEVLHQLSPYYKSVISTGGGIILKPQNWSYLREGLVIWLNVALEAIEERLRGDQTRPLLRTHEEEDALKTKLIQLWQERQHLYRQADLTIAIASNSQSSNETVEIILERIPEVLKTKPELQQENQNHHN